MAREHSAKQRARSVGTLSDLEAAMKVSITGLRDALQLRSAALRILNRVGEDVTVADSERGYCYRVRRVRIKDLTIMCSQLERKQQLLDIWQGKKVFSIRWSDGLPPYVVAICPGTWKRTLTRADLELTLDSIKFSAELKKWLLSGG
jgi:hypothetical protein